MFYARASAKVVVTATVLFFLALSPALGAAASPAALANPAPGGAPIAAHPASGSPVLASDLGALPPRTVFTTSPTTNAPGLPLDLFPTLASVPSARPLGGVVALPYSTAATDVLAAAAGFDSDTWTVQLGVGIALPNSDTDSTSTLEGGPLGCSISWIGTQPATITFPATPSSAGTGNAATYEFVLNSSADVANDLIADVVSGTATLLYTETSVCASAGATPGATEPSTVATIDSPAAVGDANRAGGTTFLQDNPSSTGEWILEPATYAITDDSVAITNPPYWIIQYIAGCGHFVAEVDALTGAVLMNESSCTPSYPVTFQETGLPAGTEWSVALSSSTNSSTTDAVGFSEGNSSYSYTVSDAAGYAPSHATGTTTVAGAAVNVSITFSTAATYSVTFQQTGLPTNTYWSVDLGNLTLVTNTSSVLFYELNGTHRFTIPTFAAWTPVPASGRARVVGAPVIVPIAFSGQDNYQLDVNETGLPAGTLWGAVSEGASSYSENFSTTSTVEFEVPNGTYFLFAGASSAQYNTSSFAEATITGAPASATFAFTGRPAYPVTFYELGLPTGSGWEVTIDTGIYEINSSASGSIGFSLPNGTYGFEDGGAPGYNATPANGSVVVSGGAANATINFTGPAVAVESFAVTFTESGLPSGTTWSVTLAGVENSSGSTTIGFTQPNGTFSYSIGTTAGYQSAPASGSVLVGGEAVNRLIAFTPLSTTPTYAVTFTEAGLPSGTSWSVTLAGTSSPSTSTTDVFTAANGSFPFSVAVVSGYTAAPSTGSVDVQGAPTGQMITFSLVATPSPLKYSVTFTESGLSSGTNWSVMYAGSSQSSATSTIVFSEPNGSYTFSVVTVAGYTAAPASGSVVVSGAAASQTIEFAPGPGTGTSPPTPSTPTTFLGLPGDDGYALVALLVVVVLGVVGVVVWRMRKTSGGATPPPAAPPASPPSTP
jgi:hypothetical protein